MRRRSPNSNRGCGQERGYVLLTLIFFVAVLAISLTAILPSVIHEAKRDREEELVHRGAQYERAILLYFKKNGHYPAKVEDLENTNEIRYLRRRYKDPMAPRDENGAEADFKILRFGDPGVRLQQPGIVPAAQAAAASAGALATTAGRLAAAAASSSTPPQADASDPNANPDASAATEDANGNPTAAGQNATDPATGQPAAEKRAPGSQSYGGGAMVGVVSTNRRDNTIREFNKKHHYYEWQFLYDPTMDRGGLPTGPWQPQTFTGQPAGQPIGSQPGQPVNPANPSGNANSDQTHDPQQ